MKHLGFVARSHLATFYNSLDALVMTSRIEAGPASVLEAMACGIAAVASNTGIVPKIVTTGHNGFCLESGKADAFVAALRELEADRARCRLMGARARETVEHGWSWSSKIAPFAAAIRGQLHRRGMHERPWRIRDPLLRLFERYVRHLESTRHALG